MILQSGKRYIERGGRKTGKVTFNPALGVFEAFVDITEWNADGTCICGRTDCEHDIIAEDLRN